MPGVPRISLVIVQYVVASHERQIGVRVTNTEPRWKFLATGGRRLAVGFTVLMLTAIPALIPSLGGLAYAEPRAGDIWAIERYPDYGPSIPIYGLEILSSTLPMRFVPGTFTARYVNVLTPGIKATDMPSTFAGEIAIREGEAIHIRQSFEAASYIAYHSGLRVSGKDRYEGRYYDNAGYQGDFVLRKIR